MQEIELDDDISSRSSNSNSSIVGDGNVDGDDDNNNKQRHLKSQAIYVVGSYLVALVCFKQHNGITSIGASWNIHAWMRKYVCW